MDSSNIIIRLIYYVGIASCAAQGAEKGKHEGNISVLYYIVNAFGGGFIRDVIFLGIPPWLLTLSALPDLGLVIITGVLYTCYFSLRKAGKKQHDTAMRLVTVTDCLGLGSFICIGMDKALIYTSNVFTITVCGYGLINPFFNIVLLYPVIYHQKRGFQSRNISKSGNRPDIYIQCPRIYIMQHRIRQC